MKLEYLADGAPECPLIRLYDFAAAEAARLVAAVVGLASGSFERVETHRLPFVQPIGGCQLTLVRRPWDQAVVQVGMSAFECGFTADTWGNVAGLIERFAKVADGFQWLAGSPGRFRRPSRWPTPVNQPAGEAPRGRPGNKLSSCR